MSSFHFLWTTGIILLLCATDSIAIRPRKVHVSYPIDLLGTNSDTYSGNLTLNKLTCFGNRDYGVPTYRETLLCMIRLPMGYNCHTIWGSRSVVVEVTGSVEFLKLNRLPAGSVFNEYISVNATRWLELATTSGSLSQREVRHVPAEPIYLCARSNDWTGSQAKFHITFRPVFLREKDKQLCHSKTLVHIILVIAVTSIWLLPYIAAVVVAALTFIHGIKFIIAIITFSCCIVSLTPLMLTKKNRHLSRLYFNYFFTRIQAEETKMVFRQRLPVLQALFFSSALVCIGSGGSYIIYTYCGIDRELRNLLLKITIGIASSWFVFFLCRSFERFCKDWVWVPMSVCLAQLLDSHLNPLSRDEVVVSTLLISLGISLSFPRIARVARSKFPKGASTVAPQIKLWANKMRVNFLHRTLRKHKINDENDSITNEFVSMTYKEDEEEEEEEEEEGEEEEEDEEDIDDIFLGLNRGDYSDNNRDRSRDSRDFDSSLRGFVTPRGYISDGEEENDYQEEEDYDNDNNDEDNNNDEDDDADIGKRKKLLSRSNMGYFKSSKQKPFMDKKLFDEEGSRSVSKQTAIRSLNSNSQLWEKLLILSDSSSSSNLGINESQSIVERKYLKSVDNVDNNNCRRSKSMDHDCYDNTVSRNSDNKNRNKNKINSTWSTNRGNMSPSGLMNLFLGFTEDEENNIGKRDKSNKKLDDTEIKIKRSKSFGFFSSNIIEETAELVPVPSNIIKYNKSSNEEKNRNALSKMTNIYLGHLQLWNTPISSSLLSKGNQSKESLDKKDEIVIHHGHININDINNNGHISNNNRNNNNTGNDSNNNNNCDHNDDTANYDNNDNNDLEMIETLYKHIIGSTSQPLSVLGPLKLDKKNVWIPMITKNSKLLNTLQNSLMIISESNCISSIFHPEKNDDIFSACLITSSYSDSIFVQKWILNPKNLFLLRSIAIGANVMKKNDYKNKMKILEDNYNLFVTVKGKEIKLILQILINEDMNIRSNVNMNDHIDINKNSENNSKNQSLINIKNRKILGIEAMQRVVLTILEATNKIICEIFLKSLQYGDNDNLSKSDFQSINSVGIECVIESDILNTVNITANNLLIAHNLYLSSFPSSSSSSSSCNHQFIEVLTSIMTSLDIKISELHEVLGSIKIETSSIKQNTMRNNNYNKKISSNIQSTDSGTCDVHDEINKLDVEDFILPNNPNDGIKKDENMLHSKSFLNDKNSMRKLEMKTKKNSFSLSLSMPIFQFQQVVNESDLLKQFKNSENRKEDSFRGMKSNNNDFRDNDFHDSGSDDNHDINNNDDNNNYKNGLLSSSETIANVCYKLISGTTDLKHSKHEVVCSDEEYPSHKLSRTLATVLLATYLTELLEFAKGDFFKSLMRSKL